MPTEGELGQLLGSVALKAWHYICDFIQENYQMETQWDIGRKAGVYEYKFRRSGKTLCALYAREMSFGFMIIYGKQEREKFEADKDAFSVEVQKLYEETPTYHDGKWLMVNVMDDDADRLREIEHLLKIKKKLRKNV